AAAGSVSFLARSFRRTLHARHEGHLAKAIATNQKLTFTERMWPALHDSEEGAIIKEAVDGGGDSSLDEKFAHEKGVIWVWDEQIRPVHSAQNNRPVDGRVYCSNERESLDSASPPLSSATSSTRPSLFMTSMKSSSLSIPTLLPPCSDTARDIPSHYPLHHPRAGIQSPLTTTRTPASTSSKLTYWPMTPSILRQY
ncbi:uncharacterized protein PHACADRAFT_266286, partial [Phanerochaete carnosa HHB-10118-sp]